MLEPQIKEQFEVVRLYKEGIDIRTIATKVGTPQSTALEWIKIFKVKRPKTKKYISLESLQELVESFGGKCLSENYVNSRTKLQWQCAKGHVFMSTPNKVTQGRWCSECSGKKNKTIEDLQKFAENKGGKCLSISTKALTNKFKWQCEKGHIWESKGDNVFYVGQWCQKCGHYLPATIEQAQDVAKFRGGKCLSSTLSGNATKLSWQCKKGHIWKASYANVKDKQSWCPDCIEYHTEKECREIFEDIFKLPFPRKTRFLNKKYELDGYCEQLKLAFEYNGKQYYKKISYWHRTPDAFAKQQYRDRRKLEICARLGVKLIVIPYTKSRELRGYIEEEIDFLDEQVV